MTVLYKLNPIRNVRTNNCRHNPGNVKDKRINNDLQNIHTHTHTNNDRVTRTPLKNGSGIGNITLTIEEKRW
jgi:hypothetical protein